ncbi:MAG: hypothetical protein WC619_05440 [Patescibacteria group bacterium]
MDSIKNLDLEKRGKRGTMISVIIIVAAIIGFAVWVNQAPEEAPVQQNTEQAAPAPAPQ